MEADRRVNTSDLDEVASAFGPKTKLVWLESPTNPRIQISDIRKIAEMAHAHGALVLVDNSIMSPVLSQPLELGAAIATVVTVAEILKNNRLAVEKSEILFSVSEGAIYNILTVVPASNPEANCGYFKWATSKSKNK
ncbi:cystathionine beta-lyase, chloroplastic-like [Vicia villosa]|uniref:cystathionine beta-lyase, chloroplastic-like n=1 Tax=Vicia villosa TaxID=3911 RepID=UPI00273B5DB3|nr:cystathionine beta-lyase, chloroplastic-like [Vicia villosa]XP_058729109.1 cystathionine beta-lyase, chloroplastic-like [Vicia villosa]XP_058729110.1 cystathionine beta-lyase, chloroplastic-like [Vicia villosa]XP_058729111.1 cystathionine beta-lyase, chloroplastic-like [Vicia villosa]XP_058729112.1 cystathionine beta-lyase, chloroplastic-like [Vicia villosa]